MPTYRFQQVDVFTSRGLRGNPVAVVLDADDIADATMQQVANWTNLSETTFVLRPTQSGADYRLRIFTPRSELPFAGHPTVGSAHAVLSTGIVPAGAERMHQECKAGLLPLTITGTGPTRRISVRVPTPRVAEPDETLVEPLAEALGAAVSDTSAPRVIDVGAVWLVALVGDEDTLRGLRPDLSLIDHLSRELGLSGVTAVALSASKDMPVVVRSFAPAAGIIEDPVCGSGNAAVGAFLADTGLLARVGPSYVSSQGREVGRDGAVSVHVGDEGRAIDIGGSAVTVIEGEIRL
jgi:PhzF family phenazine biosynthesis protein